MKRLVLILFVLILLFSLLGCTYQEQNQQWYFKRRGNGEVTIPLSEGTLNETNSYWRANAEDKVIYLTFDAGYINENVIRILDILKEENVPAAFFVLGHPILKNTDVIKRMKDEGHLVCNHTKNHKNISSMSEEELTKNLTDLEKIFEEKTGYTLDKFFRPPEGKFTEGALKVAKKLGYKNIFWSYAYADWDDNNQINPQKALNKLKDNLHEGEILLLHPTSKTNALILKDFIGYAKSKDYSFAGLSQI